MVDGCCSWSVLNQGRQGRNRGINYGIVGENYFPNITDNLIEANQHSNSVVCNLVTC